MNSHLAPLSIDPQNIIVKMPNWLGDVVMATPLLEDLKTHFPQARLTALCQSNITPLIIKDPHLTEVLGYQKPSGWIHRGEHKDVINPLRLGQYDLGILTTNSFSSAYWFWRGCVKNRIGYEGNLRSWLLSKAVKPSSNLKEEHQVVTYKHLLEPLGIPISSTPPALYLGIEDKEFINNFLGLHQIQHDDLLIRIILEPPMDLPNAGFLNNTEKSLKSY